LRAFDAKIYEAEFGEEVEDAVVKTAENRDSAGAVEFEFVTEQDRCYNVDGKGQA